jgi:hypothetical protein
VSDSTDEGRYRLITFSRLDHEATKGSASPLTADPPGGVTEGGAPDLWQRPAKDGPRLFQPIDLTSDLRDLPRLALQTPAIWLPTVLLLASFAWFDAGSTITDGSVPAFAFSLLIYPPPVVVTFVAGLMTRRSSYLAGGIVGLVAGVLFSLYAMTVPFTPPAVGLSAADIRTDNVYYAITTSLIIGIVVGAFAGLIARFIREPRP